jgi:tRNA-specific adenosine deaminase 3
MRRFMLETIAASKQNQQLHPDDIPITAVLVNPRTSEILLTAHDTRISSRHPLNHSVMLLLNQLPSLLPADTSAAAPETEETGEQYYANSYDVYVTHEPCTMCCMAMVHSRVRRLIFWKGMPTGAGWLGWMKGDEEETLNHRYMCFQGIGGSLNQEMGIGEINGDVCA